MPARKPSPELRAFGAEVTRLRESAGLTRTELAALASVSRSYVSQVESGNTRCREDFAKRLDKALGSGERLAQAWNKHLRSTPYPRHFTDFSSVEPTASVLRAYESRLVYGLLQTEHYMRALLETQDAVEARLRRQAILTREHAPTLFVILDATVLIREVGGRKVMREQLEHLIAVSEQQDNVHLQIAPIAYHRGAKASFAIATQPDRSEVVYLDRATGADTSTDAKELATVSETFSRLQAHSLSVCDSLDLIRKVVREQWT
ncbi:helix-turn-helix domain-containing protein [Actinomadura fibrosa]|uniref:Scr1 family TA system antitoxin-like transcriptional regulator n=1 Tax=Actinomadura fibrosa TaxID=111802 RepID=A0ABW2XTM0_9ACTN|nr:helix-turn-helix transcriptional regulator [Actinomadura fibrosa]